MSKSFFEGEISQKTLKVTDSFVNYGDTFIPISAISCFTVKRPNERFWLVITLFILSTSIAVLGAQINREDVGVPVLLLGATVACITFINLIVKLIKVSQRRLSIVSHSGNSIEIKTGKLRYKYTTQEIANAICQAIEYMNEKELRTDDFKETNIE